jgi:1-acyl-sn-glycerol-3-phosphate acyltransferase
LGARLTSPADYSPEAVAQTIARAGLFFGEHRYFGLEVSGWEHVPPSPVMVVMNHSGGTTIPDVWGFGVGWYRHFGVERPIHLAAHDMILATARTRRFFGRRGVLRGSRQMARRVLSTWRRDLMVMPGGDEEVWRPFHRRYEVQFGGRVGYAVMALRCGVPIVPVAHAGAHETLIVLDDGRWLAGLLGLKRVVRAGIWPLHLSLPWGLALGPLPHIPIPARLRYRIGRPIQLASEPLDHPPAELVARLDARVRSSVQAELDALRTSAGSAR